MRTVSAFFSIIFFLPLLSLAGESEIPHVINNDGPTQGIQPLALTEMWRAGGEDEDIIFGRIVDVNRASNGDIAVLDNQLCQVMVFSADGEHLRNLSREGDGPGEIRQPVGFAYLSDEVVGVGVGYPGKMVALQLDGTPITSYYPIGDPSDGNVGIMLTIQRVGDILVACGGRMVVGEQGVAHMDRFLSVTDPECKEFKRILVKANPLDPTGQSFIEKDHYYLDFRWALSPQGRIYAAMDRDNYEISVFDTSGELLQTFGRPYKPRKRDQSDKDEVTPLINMAGDAHRDGWEIDDYDPCISRVLFNHDEKTVWVQTAHGGQDQPDGILETWDVFSTDGEYLREVPIPLGHEMNDGASYLVGDGRLVVVKGTSSVFNPEADTEDEEEEAEPLEVICYKIQ